MDVDYGEEDAVVAVPVVDEDARDERGDDDVLEGDESDGLEARGTDLERATDRRTILLA
jgi:hypothetical protein